VSTNLIFIVGCVLISFIIGFLSSMVLYRVTYKPTRYDGTLSVSEEDTSQIHQLEITTDPEQLADQDKVVFKVVKIPTVED
jgi:hypothetical protein